MGYFSFKNNLGHTLLNWLIVTFGIVFLSYYADAVQHETDAADGVIFAPFAGFIALIISFIIGLILEAGSKYLTTKSKTMSRWMLLLQYSPSIFVLLLVLRSI
jgi:hypothetical protein